MSGLRFSIAELLREIELFGGLASKFLENEEAALHQMRVQLQGIQSGSHNGVVRWELQSGSALRTTLSAGAYEPGGGGGLTVAGSMSFLWEVERISGRRRRDAAKELRLVGNASTVLKVFVTALRREDWQEVASWRVELGDKASPGCHFHTQILGEVATGPFPSGLSIPRLPTCFATPLAAMEFLLSEMFQDEWDRHLFRDTDALKGWRKIQQKRLSSLFAWHAKVSRATARSPWTSLKSEKPLDDLFVVA
jgi:hypothetical protein